jgi:hypothetical protein
MMNSLNAERAVSIRFVLAIPALLLIVMSVHSSLAKPQDKPAGTQAKAKVELTTDPSPAQKGSNTIRVKLTDPAGKPISELKGASKFLTRLDSRNCGRFPRGKRNNGAAGALFNVAL